MLVATLAAVAALALGPAPAPAAGLPAVPAALATTATAGVFLQQPPSTDSLYVRAREALNAGEYRQAADAFARIRETAKDGQASEALYWRAFALYKLGGTGDLRSARESLRELRSAGTGRLAEDVASLDTRICGELAKRGDARCAAQVTDLATAIDAAVSAAGSVAGTAVAAAAEAMRSPEVQAALAEASVVAGQAAAEGARIGVEAARAATEALSNVRVEVGGPAMAARRGRQPSECAEVEDGEAMIALNAMVQMNAEQAMPLLRKVMARRDRCSEVMRRRAVFLIAQKRTPDVADLLMDAARNDPDKEVRAQAVYYLGRVPGARSLAFLRDVATRPGDSEVRQRAVYALATMKTPEARAALRDVAAARETDREVRGDAIYRLGTSGVADDVAFLRELYPRLESRDLKERVLHAVARQPGAEAWLFSIATNTSEPIELRKQAIYQAGNRKDVPLDQLFALYDRVSDREMKEQLIYTYSRRSEPAAVDRMITIARTEKDKELRKAAVNWLARSKANDPRVVALLTELIDG